MNGGRNHLSGDGPLEHPLESSRIIVDRLDCQPLLDPDLTNSPQLERNISRGSYRIVVRHLFLCLHRIYLPFTDSILTPSFLVLRFGYDTAKLNDCVRNPRPEAVGFRYVVAAELIGLMRVVRQIAQQSPTMCLARIRFNLAAGRELFLADAS